MSLAKCENSQNYSRFKNQFGDEWLSCDYIMNDRSSQPVCQDIWQDLSQLIPNISLRIGEIQLWYALLIDKSLLLKITLYLLQLQGCVEIKEEKKHWLVKIILHVWINQSVFPPQFLNIL